nr:laccase domain-containing protein [Lysobacter sp.]
MAAAWLPADWPAPPSVRAITTLRRGLGESAAPFDRFNLGNRNAADGDDPDVVARNRALLVEHVRLPSPPHWLRQVHGTAVCRFDGPAPPCPVPEPEADAAVTAAPGSVLAILT